MFEPNVSVIIPFLNEADNIENLVNRLNEFFSSHAEIKAEVIFVDDGSTDQSSEILKQLHHETYNARLIRLSKNFGSHSALRCGILHANGKYVTFVYADLQDPLDLITRLYNLCKTNDIVWATRNTVKISFMERFFSKAYAKLMRQYVAGQFPTNGFDIVMFNDKVKAELNQNIESNSSIFLQILTMGFKQESITYDKNSRKFGKSKWTLSKKMKLIIDSFVAFSYAPIRLVSIIGFVMAFAGLIWALYIFGRAIIVNDLNQGWPTLISVLMIGFGITNISLGIIAEYLWRTLDASRKRKAFIIDEIKEL